MINNNNNNNNNYNNNNNFKNASDDVLNYQTIETHPERISKLKLYINKHNWEGIDYPAGSKEWQTFVKNNETIALNYYIYHMIQKQVLLINQNIIINVKNK